MLIETDDGFCFNVFKSAIDGLCLVIRTGSLMDGRLLLDVWLLPRHDRNQLASVLSASSGIRRNDCYKLDMCICEKESHTNLEMQIIMQLAHNPRIQTSSIASNLNRSPKGVKKAIARLVQSKLIQLTLQLHSSMLLIIIHCPTEEKSTSRIVEWVRESLFHIQVIETSSRHGAIFCFLLLITFEELRWVLETVKTGPFADVSEFAICNPLELTSPHETTSAAIRSFQSMK